MRSAAVHPHTWTFVLLGFAIIGSTLVLSQFLSWTAIVILFCAAAAAATIVARPQWGAYALAFFAPMSGLVIDFSRSQSLSRVPLLSSINAPLADLFAIFLLIVIAFLFLLRPETLHIKALSRYWQLLIIFFIAVGISTLLVDALFFGTAVKAFFRPYLFMWLGFAAPILLLLKTRTELFRALFAYECAAVFGALMGAVSLVTQNVIGFVRATPFSINGYAPFGVNHNVLAESLTAIIPFAWWFASKQPHGSRRTWLFAAATLISVVALLTFSRAAWIVMTVQLVAFLWWRGGQVLNRKELVNSMFAAIIALIVFFLVIQTTSIADSSDNTRKDLLGIAITYWQRAPWFGQGPGMYVPLVSETVAFRMDYGAAMDAHGAIQKLMLEVGLVGSLAFALYIGFIARGLWIRRTNEFQFLMLITLVSLWGYQLFNTGYFDGKVWVLMGIILASIYEKK